MAAIIRLLAVLCLICTAPSAMAADGKGELAPTGTLRVAIGVGPIGGAFYATKDASGAYRGVTVELATALARKIGVPLVFVPYLGSGDIQNAANSGAWDVTFMPVDDERKRAVAFGNAYHLLQSTYLVAASSPVTSIAQANRAGFRIVGVKDTATFRASNRASPNATHIAVAGPEEAIGLMRRGDVNAIALSRESLGGIAASIPATRILPDAFLNSTTAIAVPNGKPAARAYVTEFIEEAKATGLVRAAFDRNGLQNSVVAPAGTPP